MGPVHFSGLWLWVSSFGVSTMSFLTAALVFLLVRALALAPHLRSPSVPGATDILCCTATACALDVRPRSSTRLAVSTGSYSLAVSQSVEAVGRSVARLALLSLLLHVGLCAGKEQGQKKTQGAGEPPMKGRVITECEGEEEVKVDV